MDKPGIRYLRALEVEDLQIGEGGQDFQTLVGDIGVVKMQFLQVGQRLQVDQSRVADAGLRQREKAQVLQAGEQITQFPITDLGREQIEFLTGLQARSFEYCSQQVQHLLG
jgi:hypothetical protein